MTYIFTSRWKLRITQETGKVFLQNYFNPLSNSNALYKSCKFKIEQDYNR